MHLHPTRARVLATCLSALAGYVDATGFLMLGGFFVSFMSGNTTRLAVGIARGSSEAAMAAGLIGLFVVGVIAGSLVGHYTVPHRRVAILALVAVLLALAAGISAAGAPGLAAIPMALAMGAENAVFADHGGEVRIGLTYMTGTLVKLGQRLTAALLGGDRFAWTPYLLLWLGLAGGGVTGALVYSAIDVGGLWIAAVIAAILAVAAWRIGPDPVQTSTADTARRAE